MSEISLGIFLTTYERTDCLDLWIECIKNQTVRPNKVLVIDNSESNAVMDFFNSIPFDYYKVGYNSGPAGAASIGLKKLYEEGCDWIYWGDDDDPPEDPKTFERLLERGAISSKAGIIGKLGGKFNSIAGRTRVHLNSELAPILESDYVPGNKHILVSSKVVQKGILSEPKLFFGFEELEFCLRVKDAGFSIYVDGQGIIDSRRKAGNVDRKYRWKGKSFGDLNRINRQYYSLRNMLYILWSRGNFFGYGYFLIRSLIKIPFSLIYGFSYFIKFSKLTLIAIYHQWIGRYGQYVSTR